MIPITRIFRMGIRLATWATPHLKAWHRARHLNRLEGERHLASRNWGEAETHLTQALAERKHPDKTRLNMLLGLKEAQRKQGKTAESEKTVLLAIELAVASKSVALHAKALDALADLQMDQKKYAEAEATIVRMEALEMSLVNPDFKRIAESTRKLATALFRTGRTDGAMKAFSRSVALSEKIHGADHASTADALKEMGAHYREMGNHVEAQRCLRRALQIHRTVAGADSHQATADLVQLAASLEESGDVEGATAEYERVLSLNERQIGGNREQKAETQAHLASIYLRIGRTSAARELLTHAIGVLERKQGDERLDFALETMAALEDQLQLPGQAQMWREKASESAALRQQNSAPAEAVQKYY